MTTATIGSCAGTVGRPSHHPWLAVGAVLLGAFIASFDVRLFALGLPDLRGQFGRELRRGGMAGNRFHRAADPDRPRHRLACHGLRLAPRPDLAEPALYRHHAVHSLRPRLPAAAGTALRSRPSARRLRPGDDHDRPAQSAEALVDRRPRRLFLPAVLHRQRRRVVGWLLRGPDWLAMALLAGCRGRRADGAADVAGHAP